MNAFRHNRRLDPPGPKPFLMLLVALVFLGILVTVASGLDRMSRRERPAEPAAAEPAAAEPAPAVSGGAQDAREAAAAEAPAADPAEELGPDPGETPRAKPAAEAPVADPATEPAAPAAPVSGPDAPLPGVWNTATEAVMETAKKAGMPALLFFTGNDWCPNCQRLRREALDTAEWKAWAATNLFLAELDFPRDPEKQHPRRRAINKAIAEHYGADAFPTLVLLGPDGGEVARLEAMRGAPPAFYERQVVVALFEADEGKLRAALGDGRTDDYLATKKAVETYVAGVELRRNLLNAEGAAFRKRLDEAPDRDARAAVEAGMNKRLNELVQDYRSFQEEGLAAARAGVEKIEAVRDELAGPAGNPLRLSAPAAK